MKYRRKTFKEGDMVSVKNPPDMCLLPLPLPKGSKVKILSFEIGLVWVEADAGCFPVNISCLDVGKDYEFQGKWYDEKDPVILRELGKRSKRRF